jgi:hypothetical protein
VVSGAAQVACGSSELPAPAKGECTIALEDSEGVHHLAAAPRRRAHAREVLVTIVEGGREEGGQ